jgi:anti-anti-sigma regulatory factor
MRRGTSSVPGSALAIAHPTGVGAGGVPASTMAVHEQSTLAPDGRGPQPPRVPGVEVEYCGDGPTVAVTGRVDHDKVTEVSGTVRGLIAVGISELVVDLTHAWDGARLLTVLARTRADFADHGGSLRLVGVRPALARRSCLRASRSPEGYDPPPVIHRFRALLDAL